MAKSKTLYDQIKAEIDNSDDGRYVEVVSTSGGFDRHLVWTETVTGLNGSLFGNMIALLQPDKMLLTCAGHNTATTVEALNHVMGGRAFGTQAGVLMFHDEPMPDLLALDYDGNKVMGSSSTLAPIRGVVGTRSGKTEDDRMALDVTLDGAGRAGKGVARSAAQRYFGDDAEIELVAEDGDVYRFALKD